MSRQRMLFLIAALLAIFALPASAQATAHPHRAIPSGAQWHGRMAGRAHGMHRRWHRREMRWHRRDMRWHRRRGMPPV